MPWYYVNDLGRKVGPLSPQNRLVTTEKVQSVVESGGSATS